jgi:hypothetical protein
LKKNIYFWIQQFYFGRKQKYLWKCCYTVKKPLKDRALVLLLNFEPFFFDLLASVGLGNKNGCKGQH